MLYVKNVLIKVPAINKFSSFGFCIFLLFLSGCGPQFGIQDYHNNLRGTDVCEMQNNIVKKTNCRGAIVNFNLSRNTEHTPPYSLTVLISALNCAPASNIR